MMLVGVSRDGQVPDQPLSNPQTDSFTVDLNAPLSAAVTIAPLIADLPKET
jgi:hypothetical protein